MAPKSLQRSNKKHTFYERLDDCINDYIVNFSDIDDCAENPCWNGGVCVDGINVFTCDCAHGFTGDLCNTSMF